VDDELDEIGLNGPEPRPDRRRYRPPVLGWTDSDGFRVAAYLFATVVAVASWWRERRRADDDRGLWPTFWLLSAAFFLAMAFARATDLGGLATELGRTQAVEHGWYADRRRYQAVGAGIVGVAWLTTVAIALWRVPARRRRYLPAALSVFTLMCFIGVRLISLHQIDSLLYRRELSGGQFGAVVELGLLAVAVLITAFPPPMGEPGRQAATPDLERV
jgi:hypothetical protein